MTFLNPIVLFSLVGATIPLLLHFFNLRKLKVIDFSSLKFLQELKKTSIRKLKFKRLLLLLLRIGLIVFSVLAFARPALQTSFSFSGAHSKTSIVLLIDNSGSMIINDDFGERMNRAKTIALDIVNSIESQDEVSIIPMCDLNSDYISNFSTNSEILRNKINSISLSYSKANFDNCLKVASSILLNSSNLNKEIYLISDLQKVNLSSQIDSLKLFNKNERLFVFPINSNNNLYIENIGIDSIKIITSIFEPNKPIDVKAWVHNYGANTIKDLPVSMNIFNDKVAKVKIDVNPYTTTNVTLSGVPKTKGFLNGSIEIGPDLFIPDNERFFTINVPDKINTAIIGSIEKLKFLKLVLNLDLNRITPVFFNENSLLSLDLKEFKCIVLADILLNSTDILRIKNFVESGGGVVIYGGENCEKTIQLLSTLGLQLKSQNASQVKIKFGYIQKTHPIFNGVFDEITSNNILKSPTFEKTLPSFSGDQIIKLISGGSFLSETYLGNGGKIIYVANPPDNAWSNFASNEIFVPIVIRSILYSASIKENCIMVNTNQSVTIPLPKKYSLYDKVKIVNPDSKEDILPISKYPSGSFVAFDETKEVGVYKVLLNDTIVSSFAVNPNNDESKFEKLTTDSLNFYLESKFVNKQNIKFLTDNSKNPVPEIKESRIGLELWRYMISLALICALAEMWIGRQN